MNPAAESEIARSSAFNVSEVLLGGMKRPAKLKRLLVPGIQTAEEEVSRAGPDVVDSLHFPILSSATLSSNSGSGLSVVSFSSPPEQRILFPAPS